jgi:hypothetical protein
VSIGHFRRLGQHSGAVPIAPVEQKRDHEPTDREVDVGILKKVTPLNLWMIWEDYPSWLLGIDPTRGKTLTIGGAKSAQCVLARCENAGHGITLLRRCLKGLGHRLQYIDIEDLPAEKLDLILVSGSLSFLAKHSYWVGNHPSCFYCTNIFMGEYTRDSPRGNYGEPNPGVKWSRLKHEHFGGPTSYRCLLGVLNTRFDPKTTYLRRTLGHFLNFSIRPMPLPKV